MRSVHRFIPAVALLATTVACADKPASGPPATDTVAGKGAAKAVTFHEADWKPLREADIPNDSMGASIKRGLYLLRFTPDSLPRTPRPTCAA